LYLLNIQADELEDLIEKGGVYFLPRWLQHFKIDWDAGHVWVQYISGTQKLCEAFFLNASRVGVAAYLLVTLVSAVLIPRKNGLLNPCLRLMVLLSVAYGLYQWAKAHVDETGWAKDIRGGRRYSTTANYDLAAYSNFDLPYGPSTYPTKHDVLIESRYGSKELEMYNDFIPLGHPANRIYRTLLEQMGHPSIAQYGLNLQNAVAKSIQDEIHAKKGRFLVQGADGFWMWPYDILPVIRKELMLDSKPPIVRELDQTARFIESDYKYGVFRDSALSFRHSIPYVNAIRSYLIDGITKKKHFEMPEGKPRAVPISRTTLKVGAVSLSSSKPIEVEQPSREPIREPPHVGAWIKEGDVIEVYDEDYWFFGHCMFVTAKGRYYVKYPDGSTETIDEYSIRPFAGNYMIGEELECWVPEQDRYVECKLHDYYSDDTYSATTDVEGEILRKLTLSSFRRAGPRIRTRYRFKGGYH
jgi:hypothetical protein